MSAPIPLLAHWQRPVVLLTSRLDHLLAALITRAPLLPKLRGQFAEFLNEGSLDHLGKICLPTRVGLRYGRHEAPHHAFLDRSGSSRLRLAVAARSWKCSACAPHSHSSISTAATRLPHDARGFHHLVTGLEYQPAVHRHHSFPLLSLRPA